MIGWCISALQAQTTAPIATPQDIKTLIAQLGDSDFAVREKASKQLRELDESALPALRAAMKNPDPEISQRAIAICHEITELSPEQLAAVRQNIDLALAKSDYATAAKNQELVARRRRPSIDECLAVGNDWQMVREWANAVKAYQRALERMDEVLAGDPESDPPPPPALNGPFDGPNFNGLQANPGLTDYQKKDLEKRRMGLMLLIGRLQEQTLSDHAAAIATLQQIVKEVPEFQGELPTLLPQLAAEYPSLRRQAQNSPANWDRINRGLALLNAYGIMEDLARIQEAQGQWNDALLTLARVATARNHTSFDGIEDDIDHIDRLFTHLPEIGKLPAAVTLAKLARSAPPSVNILRVDTAERGTLALDGSPLENATPVDSIAPGEHEIVFAPANGTSGAHLHVTVKAGQNYSVYLNPSSPFQWKQTNLADFDLGSISILDFAQRPDKSWASVLSANSKLYIATSHDLISWDKPLEFPYNGVANNMYAALTSDENGTLWLAWIANPCSLQPRSTAGYGIWISHSTDAKTWSPPRAISASLDGWPLGGLQWFHDKTYRLTWRYHTATAGSPGDIKSLQSIGVTFPAGTLQLDPCVAADGAGELQMVIGESMHGIRWTTSLDGQQWSNPRLLTTAGTSATNPQLVIDGADFSLVSQADGFTCLYTGNKANQDQLSQSVRICKGILSPLHRDADTTVAFTAGITPFLLTAKTAALLEQKTN